MGIWSLPLRWLRTRRIALVAVFSIAVGVLAMIVVISLMDGVVAFLQEHFKGTQSDLSIRLGNGAGPPQPKVWDGIRERLLPEMAEAGGPIRALAPQAHLKALILPGDRPGPEHEDLVKGIFLIGVDWELEREVSPLRTLFGAVSDPDLRVPDAGMDAPLAPGDPPPILLGDSLARALGVSRNSGAGGGPGLVTVITGRPTTAPGGQPTFDTAQSRVFRVAGAFSTGREDYDGVHARLDRRELLRLKSARPETEIDCNEAHARLERPEEISEVLRDLGRRHPDLLFESWETTSRQELLALQDQKKIMVVILSFIIGVAAVAILGIVYLMVVEKTRDIGILRSMGMSRSRLVAIFTAYGFLLGAVGCAAGVVLGLQATAHLDRIVSWLSDLAGVDLLDPRIYKFKTVPTLVTASSVAQIVAAALGMSLLASLIPACKAASLPPVRALRSE